MPLKVICPKGCKVRVPSSKSGAVIRCPDCRAIIRVPRTDAETRESNKAVRAKLIGEPPVPREGPAYARSVVETSNEAKPVEGGKGDKIGAKESPPAPSESKLSAIAPPPIEGNNSSDSTITPPPVPSPESHRSKRKRPKKTSSSKKRQKGNESESASQTSIKSKAEEPSRTRPGQSNSDRSALEESTESSQPSQPVFKLDDDVPAPPLAPDNSSAQHKKDGPHSDSVVIEPPVEYEAQAEIIAEAVGGVSPAAAAGETSHDVASTNGDARSAASSASLAPNNAIPSVGMEPDDSKCLTARSLSIVMVIAGLFTMGPAIYQLFVWSQGTELVDIDRWVFVLFFLAGIHFLYASYLVQLPDWSSVWVVSFLMLVMACLDALCLAGLILGDASSPIAQALQIGAVLRSKAMLWVLCMLSIHALLCYFCGREAIRWKRTYDVYVSLLE